MSGGGDNGSNIFASGTSARAIKKSMVSEASNVYVPKRTTVEIRAMLAAIIERINDEPLVTTSKPIEETPYTRMVLRTVIKNPNLAFDSLDIVES